MESSDVVRSCNCKSDWFFPSLKNIHKSILFTILLSNKTKVVPSSLVFRCAQIRSKEKEMAIKSGFNTPKWFLIKNTDDLISSIKNINKEGILKTNSLGYDG